MKKIDCTFAMGLLEKCLHIASVIVGFVRFQIVRTKCSFQLRPAFSSCCSTVKVFKPWLLDIFNRSSNSVISTSGDIH